MTELKEAYRFLLKALLDSSVIVRREAVHAIIAHIDVYRSDLTGDAVTALRRSADCGASRTVREAASQALNRLEGA